MLFLWSLLHGLILWRAKFTAAKDYVEVTNGEALPWDTRMNPRTEEGMLFQRNQKRANPPLNILLHRVQQMNRLGEWTTPAFPGIRVRVRRGAEDDHSKAIQQYESRSIVEYPRLIDSTHPMSTQASRKDSPKFKDGHPSEADPEAVDSSVADRSQHVNGSIRLQKGSQVHNPLYPVTENSYSSYAVMLLSLIVFAVGIIGNLSIMCIVCHNYYMKSAWNSILASLAFWDFLVLFFCLPVVIFNEITKKRLIGEVSCRIVPYIEYILCADTCPGTCKEQTVPKDTVTLQKVTVQGHLEDGFD